jgi:hypothetical protein
LVACAEILDDEVEATAEIRGFVALDFIKRPV